jgi:hypothetical protein
MISEANKIKVFYGYNLKSVIKSNGRVEGAVFKDSSGKTIKIEAKITIDATEYGDLLASVGCEYRIGRESKEEAGEEWAPDNPDDIIQDITYVAILKDYGPKADKTIKKPENYNPDAYRCCCKQLCNKSIAGLVDAKTMLDYGKLPNSKYMVNWPINGNDYYLNVIEMSRVERLKAIEKAKEFTLGFIYFLQTEGGFKNIGLADDEFPTDDGLPFIPYNRESRRVIGAAKLTVNDILNPSCAIGKSGSELYKTGIAVGDYPLDHHHNKSPVKIEENLPKIPPFTVPYGCLVPEKVDGLLVAEKSISVTHIVNGCTRLQPCVMLIGQAAGAAAALCTDENVEPRDLNIRKLQRTLLNSNCWLMPFVDINPSEWSFQSLQRLGLSRIIKGEIYHKDWVNEMKIHPDRDVRKCEFREIMDNLHIEVPQADLSELVTRAEAVNYIWKAIGSPTPNSTVKMYNDVKENEAGFLAIQYLNKYGLNKYWADSDDFLPNNKIKRGELVYLLDRIFDPFNKMAID